MNEASVLEELKTNGLDLTVGQSEIFRLDENKSTGYTWIIDNDAIDGKFSVANEYIQENAHNILGAGGQHVFTITGDETGEGAFKIASGHAWEDN
mmetsp:Transcript_22281/g.15890  ORF Transcript_22281/g.15890 Transcript_22281/m.15890 type:complete len:95 (+) Transcript_22281:110-394(+)|eukprot:CAMPEP_0116881352 /NCGR_PEP_ID=MMETSP0463-20121206/13475_1 /TAXON_ID=181622 /ORGANISM="Strombidinopsis sp, Strain SopsisLIS2011" /LENGTH=94 /DNA_ID=CAMNT_0004533233 /DNA_START=109 /DNA_END=393 /DNA_ORIENTATION=+